MKKIIVFAFVFCLFSCELIKPKQEYRFVYGFENDIGLSGIEIKNTIAVIQERLVNFGVASTVERFGKNQIEVKIKANELNIKRVDRLIANRGKLEFWELYPGNEFRVFLNDFKIDKEKLGNSTAIDTIIGDKVSLINLVTSNGYNFGPEIFYFNVSDTTYINNVLFNNSSKVTLPYAKRKVEFLWGIPDASGNVALYAAKSNSENKPPLTGEVITRARQVFGVTGKPEIAIKMNEEGALIWERITGKAFQNRTSIAITLNDIVYSAPGVTSGAIKGGNSSISGNFTLDQAQDLAAILTAKKTIPKLKLLEQTTIGNK
ncbi:SecDF P1 head subdomain-containing protein [Hyunsoonleella pacifica]|uniref:SecDF P1 head subdomain domain-containing protein n=1 Tax=Hyunsoonleella pacifica TaxID=1080224 RepID=A0A4Q9FN72_9FLAO|nr:hypothetical protein [Hyunsoonleella pacifica]TBN13754.1 hypothetical protein EYD46_14755 [Hyunsoonleella pacifica]GGD25367.1 hypothetical protein GCM10011368_29260 [Hyunsoonleella pacifica]